MPCEAFIRKGSRVYPKGVSFSAFLSILINISGPSPVNVSTRPIKSASLPKEVEFPALPTSNASTKQDKSVKAAQKNSFAQVLTRGLPSVHQPTAAMGLIARAAEGSFRKEITLADMIVTKPSKKKNRRRQVAAQ